MFTKLDMTDIQHMFTDSTKLHQDGVTANSLRLEFSVFGTREYSNLISLHPMFTKLDIVDNQLVLMNYIE